MHRACTYLPNQPKGGGVTDNKLSIPYIDASSIIEMIIRAHEPRYISIFAAAVALWVWKEIISWKVDASKLSICYK